MRIGPKRGEMYEVRKVSVTNLACDINSSPLNTAVHVVNLNAGSTADLQSENHFLKRCPTHNFRSQSQTHTSIMTTEVENTSFLQLLVL